MEQTEGGRRGGVHRYSGLLGRDSLRGGEEGGGGGRGGVKGGRGGGRREGGREREEGWKGRKRRKLSKCRKEISCKIHIFTAKTFIKLSVQLLYT